MPGKFAVVAKCLLRNLNTKNRKAHREHKEKPKVLFFSVLLGDLGGFNLSLYVIDAMH